MTRVLFVALMVDAVSKVRNRVLQVVNVWLQTRVLIATPLKQSLCVKRSLGRSQHESLAALSEPSFRASTNNCWVT
ncbi:MAG: hypothetical protein R3E66_01210 [bacterium]